MSRRVTSFDVAEAAGVSRTTVSFVLNDVSNQSIPEKTRLAVLEAAKKLGYTPSAAARALRAGSSRLVLVLGPKYHPSELMDAGMSELTHRLRKAGYATVIAMSVSDAESLDVLWQSVSPAAIVSMFDMPPRTRETIRAMNIPIIDALFHTAASMPGQFELQVDVGRQQAAYVISHGATHIVFAHPPRDDVDFEILDDRWRGVREVATSSSVPFSTLEVTTDDAQLAHALEELSAETPGRHLAICAYNDLTALAILQSARTIGMTAPGHFSIIGVDDLAAAAYASPPLTSVRFEIVEHIGSIAAQVIEELEGAGAGMHTSGPLSRVVARQSV
jgi:DNA-binding LacI/PurR family transcriptional regulator